MSGVERYPDYLMPIAGSAAAMSPEALRGSSDPGRIIQRYERFLDLREAFLLDYGYNTARAYWSDLDDLWLWCENQELDLFKLGEHELFAYCGTLRTAGYSENTIRRRRSSFRAFFSFVEASERTPAQSKY